MKGQADADQRLPPALVALIVVIVGLLVTTLVLFGEGFFVRPHAEMALPWLPFAVGLLRSTRLRLFLAASARAWRPK